MTYIHLESGPRPFLCNHRTSKEKKKRKSYGTYSHAHTPYIRECSHIQNISILTFFPSGFDSDKLSFPQVVSTLYKEPTSTGRDGVMSRLVGWVTISVRQNKAAVLPRMTGFAIARNNKHGQGDGGRWSERPMTLRLLWRAFFSFSIKASGIHDLFLPFVMTQGLLPARALTDLLTCAISAAKEAL